MSVRPRLIPGAAVVRRDAGHLLVGTDPGVVVPDRPGLVGLLRLVDGVRDTAQLADRADPVIAADVPEVVRELLARGALEVTPPAPLPRLAVSVRATAAVRPLATALRTVVDELDLAPSRPGGPALVVLVGADEPARGAVATLAADGVPHLLVTALGPAARVGPLVVPGLSPCLTCLDLGRTDRDPAWPVVLSQLETTPLVRPRADPSPLLRWETAALVGAEVEALAHSARPRSAGATLRLTPGRTDVAPFGFHHRCGCWLLGSPGGEVAVS